MTSTTGTSSKKRTALITGSTDGDSLGFTAAFLLATQHDYNVILTGRNHKATTSAAKEMEQRLFKEKCTSKVFALLLDVTNDASIEGAVSQLSASKGILESSGGALDVLINNAGISGPSSNASGKGMMIKTENTTADDMNQVLSTNVAAVVQVTNAFIPLLSKSDAPRIVNVSSARGSLHFEAGLEPAKTGSLIYNTSKAALNMVTLMQAKNLPGVIGPNLKVNAVSPGHVKTAFNDYSGKLTVEEGASVYVHLATLPNDGPNGQLIGCQSPFIYDGNFVQLSW